MATDSQQHWNAQEYARHVCFGANLVRPLIGMLDPKPVETILDLGCGHDVLTAEIERLGATVIGVDRAEAIIDAARKLGSDARLRQRRAPFFKSTNLRFRMCFSGRQKPFQLRCTSVCLRLDRFQNGSGC